MIKNNEKHYEDVIFTYNINFATITMRLGNSISKLLYTQYLYN